MKLDPTPIPAAAPVAATPVAATPVAATPVAATPVAATPAGPTDEAHKRAIADAVWTDLLWLMPPDRTVTITVDGGNVAVDLGPPEPARCAISH